MDWFLYDMALRYEMFKISQTSLISKIIWNITEIFIVYV